MNPNVDDGDEPRAWLLIFSEKAATPWLDRVIPGRFKHVSAAGWVPSAKGWIFYDAAWRRTSIKVLAGDDGDLRYAKLAVGNGVLKVEAQTEIRGAVGWRLGFWCVPAIKHLIGSRAGALRPDTLWRDLVANGAEVIQHGSSSPDHNGSNRRGIARGEAGEAGAAGVDAGGLAAGH